MQISNLKNLLRQDTVNVGCLNQFQQQQQQEREQEQNQYFRAPVPTSKGFVGMLLAYRTSGGILNGEELSHLLNEYRQIDHLNLTVLFASDSLFHFSWRNNVWVPMFQFELSQLSIRPECRLIFKALKKSMDDWSATSWMVNPNTLLDKKLPIDLIEFEFASVLSAASVAKQSP